MISIVISSRCTISGGGPVSISPSSSAAAAAAAAAGERNCNDQH